ncbi:alpha/beta hydrolase [Aspergillus alliaceus]|uniref:alpha/beta hydrolase n=1 Tax=Petromyces alliaceus TaxID=209559 RepID=UPI0012A537FE|nr:Alpha/Beta hydrolase protein [Aspergillus alliaceus]KAB8227029.1 Alpha/Beta hydrolase protein [Aspergillus alliaceus]
MPSLDVPGASINYEIFGSGPLLLCIPGADGRGSVFHEAAKAASDKFSVVCWDRRGYSKSLLRGPQNLRSRLETDADDAERLISHLSSDGAYVFGTSSGAIVTLMLLSRHSEVVKTAIVHEPPAFTVLPDDLRQQAAGFIQQIYDTYRSEGPQSAMEVFTSGLSDGKEAEVMRSCISTSHGDEIRANSLWWFEFELRQYTSAVLHMDSILTVKEKVMIAVGVDSAGLGVAPASIIAGQLGKEYITIPGGHVSYMVSPESFITVFQVALSCQIIGCPSCIVEPPVAFAQACGKGHPSIAAVLQPTYKIMPD